MKCYVESGNCRLIIDVVDQREAADNLVEHFEDCEDPRAAMGEVIRVSELGFLPEDIDFDDEDAYKSETLEEQKARESREENDVWFDSNTILEELYQEE